MSVFGNLRRLLALRCEEASQLASHELDEPLGVVDRLALRGHLLACRSCRRLRAQFRWIGGLYRGREAAGEGLTPEVRRRIARALESANGEGNGECLDRDE
jgi:hypothetical protein